MASKHEKKQKISSKLKMKRYGKHQAGIGNSSKGQFCLNIIHFIIN